MILALKSSLRFTENADNYAWSTEVAMGPPCSIFRLWRVDRHAGVVSKKAGHFNSISLTIEAIFKFGIP